MNDSSTKTTFAIQESVHNSRGEFPCGNMGVIAEKLIWLCADQDSCYFQKNWLIMREMTKEELELEIEMLSENIKVLIGLGYEVSGSLKTLAEYREKLLSLTRTDGNTNQAK